MNTWDNCIKVCYSAAWILSEKSLSVILVYSLFLCTALSIMWKRSPNSNQIKSTDQDYCNALLTSLQSSTIRDDPEHSCASDLQSTKKNHWLPASDSWLCYWPKNQHIIIQTPQQLESTASSLSLKTDLWHAINLNVSVFSVKWEPPFIYTLINMLLIWTTRTQILREFCKGLFKREWHIDF